MLRIRIRGTASPQPALPITTAVLDGGALENHQRAIRLRARILRLSRTGLRRSRPELIKARHTGRPRALTAPAGSGLERPHPIIRRHGPILRLSRTTVVGARQSIDPLLCRPGIIGTNPMMCTGGLSRGRVTIARRTLGRSLSRSRRRSFVSGPHPAVTAAVTAVAIARRAASPRRYEAAAEVGAAITLPPLPAITRPAAAGVDTTAPDPPTAQDTTPTIGSGRTS